MDELLRALEATSFATAIREGDTLFPWIESFHVLAIVTVVGTISIIDMRLIGVASHRKSVRRLFRDVLPITWTAFAFAAATGFLLFASRAEKYASLWQFDTKMALLGLAGLNMAYFHLVTFRNVHLWDELADTPAAAKMAGIVSLCVWIGIVICGRLVGFAL
jgi:hypothetical protein